MTAAEETPAVEVLAGGIANAGAVLRVGNEVQRPASAHSRTILALLRHLQDTGFDGASVPIGLTDGRERLVYLPGDVPVPPYPPWAQTAQALASVARLLRRLHQASGSFRPAPGATWSTEMADPDASRHPRSVFCHNDVCLENVVFRGGEATALLDFDFAPGRPLYDLAQTARLCIPLDPDPVSMGWHEASVDATGADAPARMAVMAEAYDVPPASARSCWRWSVAGSLGAGSSCRPEWTGATPASWPSGPRSAAWRASTAAEPGGPRRSRSSAGPWGRRVPGTLAPPRAVALESPRASSRLRPQRLPLGSRGAMHRRHEAHRSPARPERQLTRRGHSARRAGRGSQHRAVNLAARSLSVQGWPGRCPVSDVS